MRHPAVSSSPLSPGSPFEGRVERQERVGVAGARFPHGFRGLCLDGGAFGGAGA